MSEFLSGYEDVQGFGVGEQSDVDELNKALSAGHVHPPTAGGGVLRAYSLESTLKVVTYQMSHIRFWKNIPKLPAASTVEEYNELSEYGGDGGGFTSEGALPETEDTTYARRTKLVKFMGTTREVTHPMTLVRPVHGNVVAQETQNGTMWLLKKLEGALFNGNSAHVDVEFDGLDKMIKASGNADNVIDLRGDPIEEADLTDAAEVIVENYGIPTTMYSGFRSMRDLNKLFYPRERYIAPADFSQGRAGFALQDFVFAGGVFKFEPSVFIKPGAAPPASASSSKAPSAPSAALDSAANTSTQIDAGTYFYQVTGVNKYGESAPSAAASQVVGANEDGKVTVTEGGGTYTATAYNIYRGTSATNAKFLETIAVADNVYLDDGSEIPGTENAYLIQEDLQNLSFKQLAPFLKIPLATIAASVRWMQLLYGVPIVYSPKKNVVIKNIGPRT